MPISVVGMVDQQPSAMLRPAAPSFSLLCNTGKQQQEMAAVLYVQQGQGGVPNRHAALVGHHCGGTMLEEGGIRT